MKRQIKKLMMVFNVLALTVTLAGLSSCSKPTENAEKEESEESTILENEGELEIEVGEDEETFGE